MALQIIFEASLGSLEYFFWWEIWDGDKCNEMLARAAGDLLADFLHYN